MYLPFVTQVYYPLVLLKLTSLPHADSIFPQLPPAVRSSQLETSARDHKQTSSFLPGVPSWLKKISQTDGVLEDQWQLYQIDVRAYGSSHTKKFLASIHLTCQLLLSTHHPLDTHLKFHSESFLPLTFHGMNPPNKAPLPSYHPQRWKIRLLIQGGSVEGCSSTALLERAARSMDPNRQTHKWCLFSVPLKKGDGNNHLISSYFHILYFLRIILVFFLHIFICFILS